MTQFPKPVPLPFPKDLAVEFPGVPSSQLNEKTVPALSQCVLDKSLCSTWFFSYFHAQGCGISHTRKDRPDSSSLEGLSSPGGH